MGVCDKESAPSFIVPKEPVTPNRTGGYAAALRKSAANGNKITSNTKIDPIPTLERKLRMMQAQMISLVCLLNLSLRRVRMQAISHLVLLLQHPLFRLDGVVGHLLLRL